MWVLGEAEGGDVVEGIGLYCHAQVAHGVHGYCTAF